MAADGDVECTVLSRYTGSCDDRVWCEFFDLVTGGDDDLYEYQLWSHDRIHTQALGEERTGEDEDVKRVLVKFSDAHDWNTDLNQQSCIRVVRTRTETRGIERSSPMRRSPCRRLPLGS